MKSFICNLIRDQQGEALIEYGLRAAFGAAVALAVIVADPLGLRQAVIAAFQRAVDALNRS